MLLQVQRRQWRSSYFYDVLGLSMVERCPSEDEEEKEKRGSRGLLMIDTCTPFYADDTRCRILREIERRSVDRSVLLVIYATILRRCRKRGRCDNPASPKAICRRRAVLALKKCDVRQSLLTGSVCLLGLAQATAIRHGQYAKCMQRKWSSTSD